MSCGKLRKRTKYQPLAGQLLLSVSDKTRHQRFFRTLKNTGEKTIITSNSQCEIYSEDVWILCTLFQILQKKKRSQIVLAFPLNNSLTDLLKSHGKISRIRKKKLHHYCGYSKGVEAKSSCWSSLSARLLLLLLLLLVFTALIKRSSGAKHHQAPKAIVILTIT